MRGAYEQTGALFSYLSSDAVVPKGHPLRVIWPVVRQTPTGRAPITPEKLLRVLLMPQSAAMFF